MLNVPQLFTQFLNLIYCKLNVAFVASQIHQVQEFMMKIIQNAVCHLTHVVQKTRWDKLVRNGHLHSFVDDNPSLSQV